MKLNKKLKTSIKNVSALLSVLLSTTAIADDGQIDEFEIIGGTFFIGTVTAENIDLVKGDSTGVLIEGQFQGTPSTPGNSASCSTDRASALFDQFLFFGQPVCTYTAQTGVDGVTHNLPDIDLVAGTADMGAFYAFWNGTEFNQGSTTATVIDNFDGTYKFFWSSLIVGGAFNGKTGDWAMVVNCTTCPPSAAGVSVGLLATQGGFTTNTITQDGGAVVLSTDLTDTTGYTFNWSNTDDALDGGAVTATSTLTIADPSTIPVGTYRVETGVGNGNTTPIQKSSSSLLVKVIATGVIADIADNDNDGIANASDSITDVTQLQTQDGNETSLIMSTDAGRLTIGDTAICAGHTSSLVTLNDIKNYAGKGCVSAVKSIDVLGEVDTGIAGYRDFVVRGLAQGGAVQLVIPLSATLAKNPGYRLYSSVDGWKPFSTQTDSIASAQATSGVCPAVGSTEWSNGLTEGDDCVRLSIADGGANDADGQPNGIVVSTGTTVGYAGINADLVQGCSMTGARSGLKNHIDWLITLLFIAGLGYAAKRKQA